MSSPENLVACLDLIAFYHPEYHAVSENEQSHGGPAEWDIVRRGRQNFLGHKQPIEPHELGCYDLLDPGTLMAQAELAKENGIRAFCYHVYRSAGRRLWQRPLDALLVNSDINIDFCVCWANQYCPATGGGFRQEVAASQGYTREDERAFIRDMVKYLADPRYIKVGGRPLLLVARPDLLVDPKETVSHWRSAVRDAGLGELHACAIEFALGVDPRAFGFDALVEFPPCNPLPEANVMLLAPLLLNPDFAGKVFDYGKVRDWFLSRPAPEGFTRYRGVMPRWDNTARAQDQAQIFHGSSPYAYREWLYWTGLQTLLMQPPGERLVFINAWNGWTEGCMLEPDKVHRREYLRATRDALDTLNERALVLHDYWTTMETNTRDSRAGINAAKSIIMNYERSIAALRRLPPAPQEPETAEDFRRIPFHALTAIYLRRLRSNKPESGLFELFRGVPLRTLTRAYLGRLKLAVTRRLQLRRRR